MTSPGAVCYNKKKHDKHEAIKGQSMEKMNAARGGSAQAWEAYFLNSSADIARDFYALGICELEQIKDFIDSSQARTKPDAREIYNCIQKYRAGSEGDK